MSGFHMLDTCAYVPTYTYTQMNTHMNMYTRAQHTYTLTKKKKNPKNQKTGHGLDLPLGCYLPIPIFLVKCYQDRGN